MNQYGGGAGRAKCVKFRSGSRWLLVPTPKYLRPAISSFGVIKSFATGFGSKNQFLEKPLPPIFHEFSMPVPRTRRALQDDAQNKLQKAKWHGTPGHRIARLESCRVAGMSAKRFPMVLKVLGCASTGPRGSPVDGLTIFDLYLLAPTFDESTPELTHNFPVLTFQKQSQCQIGGQT